MLGASFLPARLRHEHDQPAPSNPGYLNRQITQVLQNVARAAFTHPMYTIFTVAILASTSYHGLLEGSLFGNAKLSRDADGTDLTSLVEGGRRLRLGEETSWKWQSENGVTRDDILVSLASITVHWVLLKRCLVHQSHDGCNLGFSGFFINFLPQDCPIGKPGSHTCQHLSEKSANDVEPFSSNFAGHDASFCCTLQRSVRLSGLCASDIT